MGNLLFGCGRKVETESVINLSDTCIGRLIREENESGKKSPAQELNIPEDVSEKEWMMKLKCLDDAHSNAYGLTVQAFHKLADEVESEIEPIRAAVCDTDEIKSCLKRNKCCPIRCKSEMDKYIDCIDTMRINIVKEQIDCEQKEKRREEQEIVEEFLKNENGQF